MVPSAPRGTKPGSRAASRGVKGANCGQAVQTAAPALNRPWSPCFTALAGWLRTGDLTSLGLGQSLPCTSSCHSTASPGQPQGQPGGHLPGGQERGSNCSRLIRETAVSAGASPPHRAPRGPEARPQSHGCERRIFFSVVRPCGCRDK